MTKLEEVALSIWHERAKHFGEPPRPLGHWGPSPLPALFPAEHQRG